MESFLNRSICCFNDVSVPSLLILLSFVKPCASCYFLTGGTVTSGEYKHLICTWEPEEHTEMFATGGVVEYCTS